jgi:hypothetical protein
VFWLATIALEMMSMPANTWTFSGRAKEQHEKVKAAAKAGNHAEAMRCLQAFGVYAGIASCVDLAETERAAFEAWRRSRRASPQTAGRSSTFGS